MRDDRLAYLLLAGTLAVILARVLTPGHALSVAGTCEAFAHIWVGAMLALIAFRWKHGVSLLAMGLLVIASAVEICMFLWGARS